MGDFGETSALDDNGGVLEGLFDTESDVITRRIPSRNTEYSQPRYWRTRYAGEQTILYDWYNVDFDSFWRSHMAPLCSIEERRERGSGELDKSCHEGSHVQMTEASSAASASAISAAVSAVASAEATASGAANAATAAGAAAVAPLVVVEIGSGNSEWSMRMAERGLAVISTDVDAGVMASMSQLHASHPRFAAHPVDRLVADARCLPFRGVVDVMVDKGTVDALLCQPSSKDSKLQPLQFGLVELASAERRAGVSPRVVLWTEAERFDGVASLSRSVHRSLKPRGVWLLASAKPPGVLLAAIGHLQASTASYPTASASPAGEGLGDARFSVDLLSDSSTCGISVICLTKESETSKSPFV